MKGMTIAITAALFVVGGAIGYVGRPIVAPPAPQIVEKTVQVEVPAKVDNAAVVRTAVDGVVSSIPTAGFYQIAPAALKERLDSGTKTFLLDVRESSEMANGKLPDSTNIPLNQLTKNLDKLPADKNTPIVTYCAVGYRGGLAMEALRTLGYTNVLNLQNGYGGWAQAGLPTAS